MACKLRGLLCLLPGDGAKLAGLTMPLVDSGLDGGDSGSVLAVDERRYALLDSATTNPLQDL